MGRTRIDGDQVQDESLTGLDVLDGSIQKRELDTTTSGESVITDLQVGSGLGKSETGADSGTGSVTLSSLAGSFGVDFAKEVRTTQQNITGGTFVSYSTLNFNVSDTSGTNDYRLNIDFLWGLDSASNDARFQMFLDGSQVGEELRIEPKDPGTDQRFQNNILHFEQNLSTGAHTLELRARPSRTTNQLRLYRSIIEAVRSV